ncbi:MAG TPA: acyl-CoA dehydrogenase family protein [Nakamurella sp.]|nr:acyl-CoA dehydrogenase family protein [Nakamurella sp.]
MNQFALTPPQRELMDRARGVAEEVLLPLAEAGQPGRINRPLVAALGEHGLLGRVFPGVGEKSAAADAGSRQVAALDLCLLRESIAQCCPEAETALALQGLAGYPILQSGTDRQAGAYLPGIAAGRLVAAFALTEPEAGSDAAALSLAAERDGAGWRLTGEKLWISNAPDADVYTVFARTTVGAGARGVSAFVVPADRPGLSGEPLEMISPHPIGRLVFDGVPVEPADLLGEQDRGFRVAMRTLDLFRPSVGAFAIGMAQAALDAAAAHAVSRSAFGGTLADRQAVGHLLADATARVRAARLLVYSAAAAYDAGAGNAALSAAAKLLATETAQQAIDAALQVHGARALRRGHLLEQLYRDVRATRIYEGASEVQRDIIARELFAQARSRVEAASGSDDGR